MILDNFRDIIKHTSALGFIDMVKITGKSNEVKIEAIDTDRTVVLYGSLLTPINGLDGIAGLSRMGILDGYIKFPPFNKKSAEINISTQNRHGKLVPAEIQFSSDTGHTASYRFMSAEIAEEQIKIPPFKGATWNVTITPDPLAMHDLSVMNGILGSFETTFTVKTTKNTLEFHIGEGTSDRTKLIFANDITGTLRHAWSWPLTQVLSILRLHESSKSCAMSFSDQGALKIDIDSGLGEYEYILPARSK